MHYQTRPSVSQFGDAPEGVAFIKTQPELADPDIQIIFIPCLFPPGCAGKGYTVVVIPTYPLSRGRLTLRSKDPGETGPGPHIQGDQEIAEYIRGNVAAKYHPTGTCKMGHDAMAVVDEQLRVRSIEGLRVVDASIMPTIIHGNTNAVVIMIAEKIADLMKQGPGEVGFLPCSGPFSKTWSDHA